MPNLLNTPVAPPIDPSLPTPEIPNPLGQNGEDATTSVEDWMNFLSVKVKLTRIIDDFTGVAKAAQFNRETRYKDLKVKTLRESGVLKRDETMIPKRVIDNNIRREHPLYMNYYKGGRRLMIFKAIKDQNYNPEPIEAEFTRGMSYSGHEIPIFKTVDGSQTHGWDSVEVVLDQTKPFHTSIEHVGNEMLIFPKTTQNIQFNEVVCRKFIVYPKQLKVLGQKYEFNPVELTRILQAKPKDGVEQTVCIYKCFYRIEGVVYVAWFEQQGNDWLRAPAKLFLGRKKKAMIVPEGALPTIDPMTGQIIPPAPQEQLIDEDEYMYPIFLLPYYETEQKLILDHVGRVFLDKHIQEACTANISQFLNGCQRASGLYPYLDKPTDKNVRDLESVKIESGKIPVVPVKFFQMAYPDPVMLSLQQYLDSSASDQAGQVNYTAQNRQDSRKTATEIQAASQEANQLNSVQIILFSTFLREVYTFVWGIVKSKALNQEITFLWNEGLQTNDLEQIDRDFDLRAAGDVDVVKRTEQLQQYQQFWGVVSATPVALRYLADMLRLAFPFDGKGEIYANEILLGDPTTLIAQLLEIINVTVDEEDLASLPPQAQLNMQNIILQAQGIVQRSGIQSQIAGSETGGSANPNVQGGGMTQQPKQEKPGSKSPNPSDGQPNPQPQEKVA